jgi:hypothetical protein
VRLRTTRVVLAAAHLDHDPTNNRLRNLRSLCQRCHLTHDRQHHLAQRRITYLLRRASGDLFLGPYKAGLLLVRRLRSKGSHADPKSIDGGREFLVVTAVEHDLRCRVLIVRTPGSAELTGSECLGLWPSKRLSHRPAPRPRHRVTVRGSRATSPKPLHNGPWCTSAAERFPPADPHPRGRSIPDGDACLGPQCWGLSAFVGIDQRGSGRPSQTAAS